MAAFLDQFRQKHPAYKDVPDLQLADGLYRKFYADKMDRGEFDAKVGLGAAEGDGITGIASGIKNIGQGFNRGLGRLASGADYALLGFLDDTPEGQAKRPLGYVAQVLKGERDIPGTDQRFAHEPTTTGERLLQRGGEVLGESIGPAAAIAAPARVIGAGARPATSTMERALKTLSESQAGLVAPEAGALSKLADKGASAATKKVLGDTVGGAVAKGTGAVRNVAREGKQAALLGGETAGSIGSGIGEELGRSATPDGIAGPVVGGLAGGLAPAVAAAPMIRSAVDRSAGFVQDILSPQTTARRARDFVAGHLGPHIDTPEAQARMQRADALRKQIDGFDPDLAAASGSEALKETKADIFKNASGGDLEELRAREAANEQAIRDYAVSQTPAGQGGAKEALAPLLDEREAAARQVRDLEAEKSQLPAVRRDQAFDVRQRASDQLERLAERERSLPRTRDIADAERAALDELTTRTNGARADIVGRVQRVDRAVEGSKIREGIKAERAARVAKINEMSKDFGLDDVDLNEPMKAFAADIGRWREGLLPSQKDNMPDVMADVVALAERAKKASAPDQSNTKPIAFKDIKALRESVNDAVLEASRDTSPGHRKRLANAVELRRRIDDQLLSEDLIDSDGYRNFRRAYFEEIIEPFERGAVKKTTAKDGTGFYRTLDEEVALGYLDSADAAEQIARIAKTQPELMASLEAVGLDDLASKAVANGVINPRSLERWAESRRGALQHLPGLRQTVNDLVQAVGEVEGAFSAGKRAIRDRRLSDQRRLESARSALSTERQNVRRDAARQVQRIEQQAATDKTRLEEAMDPLLARMGAHSERRMALEDAQLAKGLTAVAGGGSTPAKLIDDALKDVDLMKRLWKESGRFDGAQASLQRHLWDDLTTLDGNALRQFLDENASSLKIAFQPKHLKNLNAIADALQMTEFAAATGRAKPIKADLVDVMKRTTGLNPSAMAGSYTGIARGRSSKTVEMFNNLYRWMNERSRQATEKLMRKALFDPKVAEGLIQAAESATLKPASMSASEKFATKRLRGWLWNLGISMPIEGASEEEAATFDVSGAFSDPDVMRRVWADAGNNQAAKNDIRRQAWSGLQERTGRAVTDFASTNADSLRAVFPADHLKRVRTIAGGLSLADGSLAPDSPTRAAAGIGLFFKMMNARDPSVSERVLAEALANPTFAAALTESVAIKSPKSTSSTLDQFATGKLMRHLERLEVAQ